MANGYKHKDGDKIDNKSEGLATFAHLQNHEVVRQKHSKVTTEVFS